MATPGLFAEIVVKGEKILPAPLAILVIACEQSELRIHEQGIPLVEIIDRPADLKPCLPGEPGLPEVPPQNTDHGSRMRERGGSLLESAHPKHLRDGSCQCE